MAGSYDHVVNDDGTLRTPEESLIENLGDAWEATEEMYGMIWYFVDAMVLEAGGTHEYWLAAAKEGWKEGLRYSPENLRRTKGDPDEQSLPGL